MYSELWHSLYSQMFNQLSVVTLASISMSPSGRFYVLGVLSYCFITKFPHVFGRAGFSSTSCH